MRPDVFSATRSANIWSAIPRVEFWANTSGRSQVYSLCASASLASEKTNIAAAQAPIHGFLPIVISSSRGYQDKYGREHLDRQRVVEGKGVSVRVDLGGGSYI